MQEARSIAPPPLPPKKIDVAFFFLVPSALLQCSTSFCLTVCTGIRAEALEGSCDGQLTPGYLTSVLVAHHVMFCWLPHAFVHLRAVVFHFKALHNRAKNPASHSDARTANYRVSNAPEAARPGLWTPPPIFPLPF